MSTTMITNTIKALAMVAITMAMLVALSSITLQYNNKPMANEEMARDFDNDDNSTAVLLLPSKRINRFLGESNYDHHGRSLKPADHCHKDGELCDAVYGENFHCCGNKCFDFSIDKKHCGGCHNKCKFTYDCCDGKCVDKAYDKRHCGKCNKKCKKGQFCVYGMCDYA